MVIQKKAVSSIIASMTLILLAITLASVFFIWSRSLIGEQISKFERPIEESCPNVRLSGIVSGESITVSNNGNVPVYKLGIRILDSSGNSQIDYVPVNLFQGSSISFIPSTALTGNPVDLIPVLLGKSSKGGSSEFNCLNNVFTIG